MLRRRDLFNCIAGVLGIRPPRILPAWTARLVGSLGELFSRSIRMSNRKLEAESDLVGNLTPREVEVLRMIASGLTAKEIAVRLCLAVPTVQRHIQNIYGKIDARGRADATRWFLASHPDPQSSLDSAQAAARMDSRETRTR